MESDNQTEFNFVEKNSIKMPIKPLMADEEIDLIKSYLGKDKTFFEWGAGGSTVEFSNYVKEYYSVEHDFKWYNLIKDQAERNTKIYYVPPQTHNLEWFPVYKPGNEAIFRNYIKYAGLLGSFGKKFDIVFIDGRERLFCAEEALNYLNENAIVFIHDFNRPRYWDIIKKYRIIDIIGNMVALEKGDSLNQEKNRYYLIKKYLAN